jgi:chemotaxis protein CheD
MEEADINKKIVISEEIVVPKVPTEIVTMVGSSVAVTIFDRVLKTGGLLHFLEPEWNKINELTCKYGDVGIKSLIQKMLKNGSKRENLIANIIGGATIGEFNIDTLPIGIRNVQMAKKILDEEEIAVDIIEVGKELGRYVSFNSETGEVKIRIQKKS